jgi:hypothetical protein
MLLLGSLLQTFLPFPEEQDFTANGDQTKQVRTPNVETVIAHVKEF